MAKEIISFVFPVILGAYITVKSYDVAAIFILMFSLLRLILSLKIKNKNIQREKVKLKEFVKLLKNDVILKKLYIIEFFKGINRHGVMKLVVSLLIIYNTNNELELGGITSLFSLLTIISMYLFGKYYNKTKKKTVLLFSSVIMLTSFALILYKINMVTIIFYNITYYVFMNIILKITDVSLFDYSNKELYKDKFNTEYFIFRELSLNLGRILGYIALLVFVGLTGNLSNLKILFTFIIISIVIVINLNRKLKI